MDVDLTEVHHLAADLTSCGPAVTAGVDRAVGRGGHRVQAQAQVNAPVEFGTLKGSITTDLGQLSFEVGPEVEYGGFVEEGTTGPYVIPNAFGRGHDTYVLHPGISPQPYLGPAFDTHLAKTLRDIRDAAADGLW